MVKKFKEDIKNSRNVHIAPNSGITFLASVCMEFETVQQICVRYSNTKSGQNQSSGF